MSLFSAHSSLSKSVPFLDWFQYNLPSLKGASLSSLSSVNFWSARDRTTKILSLFRLREGPLEEKVDDRCIISDLCAMWSLKLQLLVYDGLLGNPRVRTAPVISKETAEARRPLLGIHQAVISCMPVSGSPESHAHKLSPNRMSCALCSWSSWHTGAAGMS